MLLHRVGDAAALGHDLVVGLLRVGWSVVATGHARTVNDPDEVSRYEQLLHPPNETQLSIGVAVVSISREYRQDETVVFDR